MKPGDTFQCTDRLGTKVFGTYLGPSKRNDPVWPFHVSARSIQPGGFEVPEYDFDTDALWFTERGIAPPSHTES